jgi:hypothetical protein
MMMMGSGTPNSHRHPDRMVISPDLAVITRKSVKALRFGNRARPALFPVTGLCPKRGKYEQHRRPD